MRLIGAMRGGWRGLTLLSLTVPLLLSSAAAAADDHADCNASDELLKTNPVQVAAACGRLAGQGDVIAQYNLGLMHLAGQGLPQNDALAAQWFHKAAERGDAPAQYYLGTLYESGRGVSLDSVEAATWYRRAAEQGYPYAQSNLGFMYANGEGIPVDLIQADLWLSLAAATGDGDAAAYRDFMEEGMTPDQVSQARNLVGQWRPVASGQGQPAY
jgi:TPR repeat protein